MKNSQVTEEQYLQEIEFWKKSSEIHAQKTIEQYKNVVQNIEDFNFLKIRNDAILNYLSDTVIVLDQEQCISIFNETACQLVDISAKDIIGKNIEYLPHELYMFIDKYLSSGEYEDILYFKEKYFSTVIKDTKIGKHIYKVFLLSDISNLMALQLQSETAKVELEKLLRSFDKNVIFSKTDLKGNIIHVSEAFSKISGYEASELLGNPHSIIRHPDMSKDVFKDLWNTLKNEKKWNGEIKNRKKDGGYYWVNTTIEPDYNTQGEHIGYHAVRHDITSQKEVEELKNKLQNINLDLEQQVNDRAKELVALDEEIQNTQREVVFTMGAIGESRSKETGNHVKRVAEYSKLLALKYGLSEAEAEMLKQASPMHDIGKVAIPDAILNKPGRLNEDERRTMDTHAQLGYDMLKHSNRPLLKMAATVAYEHHEKWDGSGYPNGLKGEAINIYGRITALADVFDALGSKRCYKEAWEDERIFKLFKEERAKHFDPKLIDIFFENLDKFNYIRHRYVDD